MDWNSLIEIGRSGVVKYPEIDGYNGSRALLDPVSALIKPVAKQYWSPAGSNWGHFYDPEIEDVVGQILNEFDPDKRLALLIWLHELESDRAQMIWVVHDLNPRALSAQAARLRAGAELVPGPDADRGRTVSARSRPPAFAGMT